ARLIDWELSDQTDTRRELVADLAKCVDSAEPELVGERCAGRAAVVHGQKAAIEVDVHRLQSTQQPAQEAVTVGVELHRARKIEGDTRCCRLRITKAARDPQLAGAVAVLTREAKGVRVAEHVVRGSEVQPRPEPGGDRRRDVDPRLHCPLSLETDIATKESVAVAGCHQSEGRAGSIASQVANRGDVPANRRCLEWLEDQSATVAPAPRATFDCLRGVAYCESGLKERGTIVVTIRISAVEMDFGRRPALEVGQQCSLQIQIHADNEILGLAILVFAA